MRKDFKNQSLWPSHYKGLYKEHVLVCIWSSCLVSLPDGVALWCTKSCAKLNLCWIILFFVLKLSGINEGAEIFHTCLYEHTPCYLPAQLYTGAPFFIVVSLEKGVFMGNNLYFQTSLRQAIYSQLKKAIISIVCLMLCYC